MDELREVVERGVPFDAAFIDLSPIEQDPAAAVELLRSRDAQLPVIMISGSATGVGDDLDLSGWVQKPFEIGELCRALADVMQERAASQDGGPAEQVDRMDTTGEILVRNHAPNHVLGGRARKAAARVG